MSATDNISKDEVLIAEAARWLVEQDEGFSPDRAKAFADWLAQDPRHAEAVLRVGDTLLLFNELTKARNAYVARFEQTAELSSIKPEGGRGFGIGGLQWAGIAAVLALGATVWFTNFARSDVGERVYHAEVQEPQRVALADGSVVDLNVNSELRVRISANERHVVLTKGEASFQVAHNPAKPFVVTARGVTLRAVGTAFNVRLAGDSVDLLVTEGKVKVAPFGAPAPTDATPMLMAGERTRISSQDAVAPQIEKMDAESIHDLLAWQDHMTNFVDVPLRELVARINRCNDTKLVLADADLGNRKVGGVIFLNRVDRFVQVLEREGDVVAERRGSEIVLRRAR